MNAYQEINPDIAAARLFCLKELQNYHLHAIDGTIGSLEEVYFDDSAWVVRYFVVKEGDWLKGRRVLISSVAIGDIVQSRKEIHIELSRKQIKGSPPLCREGAISRQYETEYFRYYGWPPYWETDSMFSQHSTPEMNTIPAEQHYWRNEDHCLRNTTEVTGYHISAEGGEIGHVEDFVINENDWKICYLVIDTRNWWPGKHVLLNPAWITNIDWSMKHVVVDLHREDIRTAPSYEIDAVIDRDYEIRLFEHYARRKYWE